VLSAIVFVLLLCSVLGVVILAVALARQAAAMHGEKELAALTRADLESAFQGAPPPKISFVIPARDEERNLAACLETVLAVDYPEFEVLVVDDGSTDRTPEIISEFAARDARIRPIDLAALEGKRPREEYVGGKTYVLAHAAQEATGEWLLFVDADTRQRPDGLWRAVTFSRRHELRAFSSSGIYPNPTFFGDLLESTVLIATFLAIPLRRVNHPTERHVGWANGQFVLIEREAYRSLGGHHALRRFSFDDMSLGRLIKEHGIPYRFLPGGGLFRCINYVGLAEAHAGWTRLVAGGTPWLGIGRSFFFVSGFAALLLAVLPFVLGPVVLAGALEPFAWHGLSLRHVAIAAMVAPVLIQAINRVEMKVPVWRALLVPLAAALTIRTLCMGYLARYHAGAFAWRGRKLVVDDPSEIAEVLAEFPLASPARTEGATPE
jgi:chlorobactene glucosyltransferase